MDADEKTVKDPEPREEAARKPPPKRPGQRLPIPWGLFLALALYGGLVAAYLQSAYWDSPEYQAALHYQQAWDLLGPAEGRTATRDELVAAYEHLLEAARMVPQAKRLHEQLERLNWRFEERDLSMPPDLRRRADAVAILWKRIDEANEPLLVVGLADRGWSPDQLRAGPGKVLRWSLIGVLVILGAWVYIRFSARRVRQREHDQEISKIDREVRQLAGFRHDTDEKRVSEQAEDTVRDGSPKR